MTGPEHYLEAERQADCAAREIDEGRASETQPSLGLAQVHATLALAAAFACARLGELPVWDADAWQDAAGTAPEPFAVDEDQADEPEPEEYDPGPEVDDEGGMSEYRHALPGQDWS
jgi:hypothetical protein